MAEILSYDFMQRAILAVIAISVFAPILGIFLILRHQSLMSDTLSHVSLAGVALGILLGVSTTWSTVIVVTIAAVILEYLQTVYKHYLEISTALLMSQVNQTMEMSIWNSTCLVRLSLSIQDRLSHSLPLPS